MTKRRNDDSPKQVAAEEGYDEWAADYDSFDNPMLAAVDDALGRSLNVLGRRVVEAGCGTGRNMPRVMAAGAAKYFGMDGSQLMLEKARSRPTNGRVSWRQHDITLPWPVEDSSFDFLLVTLVLEHLSDLESVASEAARVLTSGSRIRILEMHPTMFDDGGRAHFWRGDEQLVMPCYRRDEIEYRELFARHRIYIDIVEEWAPSDADAHAQVSQVRRQTNDARLALSSLTEVAALTWLGTLTFRGRRLPQQKPEPS
ncbi:MAG: class I SAM-dependent methyltransferase [Myxococcota bacterium]